MPVWLHGYGKSRGGLEESVRNKRGAVDFHPDPRREGMQNRFSVPGVQK